MSTRQKVAGIASLWCAVVLIMVAMAAPAASEPCPAGQVPVTRGGVCVPLSPFLPGPTPTTADPTTPAPSPTVVPDPAPGGTVPGQPGTAGPAPTTPPLTPENDLPASTDPGNEPPETSGGAGATASGAVTPSSGATVPQTSPVPASSDVASPRVPAAGVPDRPHAPPGTTPGTSTRTAAGYLLALGGILLLAWATVSFTLQRPASRA